MDAGSINETLLKGLQQAQFERVATLSKILGLKIGSELMASVQKITEASPEERELILKQIETTLAQLNKNSAAPAVKALITQLLDQQLMLQSPQLKLVALQLFGNNLLTDKLLTYTDKPLTLGQQLLLRLVDGNKLVFMEPTTPATSTTATNTNTNTNTTTSTAITPTTVPASTTDLSKLSALLSAAHLAQHSNENISTNQNTLAKDKLAAQAISDTLRNLLPKKDQGQDLLVALPKITQFIQQLPINERNQWLSSNLQQALKTVADHLRSPAQLTNPKLLAMVVNNGGTQFESKVAQYLTTNTNEAITAPAKNQVNTSGALLTPTKAPLEQIARQDLKGALLGLLHQLDQEVTTATRSLTTPLPTTDLNQQNANNLMLLLGQLINKQSPELNQKVLRAQLAMLMQQHTLGSLAKIQLQQIHTLSNQRTQADPTAPNQSWQVEIPVRNGNDIHPLHMQFEQHWVEDEKSTEEKKIVRVKQWNLMLSFQLPIVGQFFAQLILVGDNLSAKLWAEKSATLEEAKTKLDTLQSQLEEQGIHVKNIQCLPGLPPQPKISFGYSLVDIQT